MLESAAAGRKAPLVGRPSAGAAAGKWHPNCGSRGSARCDRSTVVFCAGRELTARVREMKRREARHACRVGGRGI